MNKVENFIFNRDGGEKRIIKAKVYYRALVLYPRLTPLSCKIKGCQHKKRNGRCGLKETRLELDENKNLTGVCLCFRKRG
jgi:hypothetical protein